VLIEAPGYYPFRTTEKINVGEATAVKYYLEKGSYNPYDVTVTVAKPRKEVSRTIISATEIDKIPGTMGDPLSVVQDLPGVARAPLLSGEIIVRGSAPEDTRVNIDGADIPLVYHFGGLRSVIPVGLLDSLEFYPGNFSPLYGRATGGMVDIQIKKLQPKRIAGYIDVSLLDTGVYLEAPLGDKGGIAIAGRRSYLDLILDAAVSSDSSINLITAPRYYDYQLVANYRPTAAHDIRALFLGSDDRFEVLFKNPATVSTQLTGNDLSTATSFYRGLVTYRYVPSDSFQNMVQLSFGRELTDDSIGQLALHLNIFSVQLRDTVQRKLGHGATLSVGTDTIYSNASGLVRLPFTPQSSLPQTPDLSQILETRFSGRTDWSPALFAELELKPARGLVLLPGVRADYFWGARETVLQPRLTARYQLGRAVTLKGGVGLFSQEPDIAETDPVFGNPNLKAERAIHYSAGAEYKPRPYVTLDATVFYKDLYSLVSSTDAQIVDADGAAKPLRYDNGGTGRAYGLELIARHDFTHRFTGWLTYTLSRSERRDSGASADQLFDFDQTHILAGTLSLRHRRPDHPGRRRRLQRRPRSVRSDLRRRQFGARAFVSTAGSPGRQTLDLPELDSELLPGRPERLQPRQSRGDLLQLQFSPVAGATGASDPADTGGAGRLLKSAAAVRLRRRPGSLNRSRRRRPARWAGPTGASACRKRSASSGFPRPRSDRRWPPSPSGKNTNPGPGSGAHSPRRPAAISRRSPRAPQAEWRTPCCRSGAPPRRRSRAARSRCGPPCGCAARHCRRYSRSPAT
jgi:hypothetical protein